LIVNNAAIPVTKSSSFSDVFIGVGFVHQVLTEMCEKVSKNPLAADDLPPAAYFKL